MRHESRVTGYESTVNSHSSVRSSSMMCRLQRSNNSQTGSALGNVITLLLLLALVGIGVYMVVNKKGSAPASEPTQSTAAPKPAAGEADADAPSPIEPV